MPIMSICEELQANLRDACLGLYGLRKEREFSFYGDIDFIPTREYSREDALRAMEDARFVVTVAEQTIKQE
jgi:hypothetical protein